MHILRPFVETIEGLSGLVAEAAGNPLTQGVVLDINPIWLVAYRASLAGISLGPPIFFGDTWLPPIFSGQFLPQTIQYDPIDLNWIDQDKWVYRYTDEYRRSPGYQPPIPDSALPFLVKIITRPSETETLETRGRLVELARRQSFLTLVETRPPGALASTPGSACMAGTMPGTIGGFLRDRGTGRVYAATCGHVAATGSSVSAAGKALGVCSHSWAPAPMPAGQSCTGGCPSANRLDLALIDIGVSPHANVVSGVASRISSHQQIVMRGGKTGTHTYEVGGLMLTYCPGYSNVCFENMFEVRPQAPTGLLNPRVASAFATIPTQGDSGSWLETKSGEWCGVLVAADHLMGYALEADDVIAEADSRFRTSLQPA